jgi:hypothetical protein
MDKIEIGRSLSSGFGACAELARSLAAPGEKAA